MGCKLAAALRQWVIGCLHGVSTVGCPHGVSTISCPHRVSTISCPRGVSTVGESIVECGQAKHSGEGRDGGVKSHRLHHLLVTSSAGVGGMGRG